MLEGSGCWYCVKAHGTDENCIDKSPAQAQKIVNNPEAPEARSGFQARRDAVVDLASRGKKQILSIEIDQTVTMYRNQKEVMKLRLKFLRMDVYEKWCGKNPKLAKQYFRKEPQSDPLTGATIWGARVPKDEDGGYDLDVVSEKGMNRTKVMDDGQMIINADQQQNIFDQGAETLFGSRGPLNHEFLAGSIGLDGSAPRLSPSPSPEPPSKQDRESSKRRKKSDKKKNLLDHSSSDEPSSSEKSAADDQCGLLVGFAESEATMMRTASGKAKVKGKGKVKAKAKPKSAATGGTSEGAQHHNFSLYHWTFLF